MASPREFRLYTFVAGLYLSELQKGLQTAHVVSEIAAGTVHGLRYMDGTAQQQRARDFMQWAEEDKTIIICSAGNHKGVVDCWAELERINTALNLPAALFREDEQSMNGMATACGVIVPRKYWDVTFVKEEVKTDLQALTIEVEPAHWVHTYEGADGTERQNKYDLNYAEGQFVNHIKQYRLA